MHDSTQHRILIKRYLLLLTAIGIVMPNPVTAKESTAWQAVAHGVWRYSEGEKEKINLLDAAGITPNLARINEFPETPFPLNPEEITITRRQGKLYVKFPLEREEQLYGLGLQFKQVNRRGSIYYLHVDHYDGQDNGRTHAPVPFYVSSKGYGVLINSARYLTVYAGTAVRVDSPHPPRIFNRNTDAGWQAMPESDAVEILVPAEKAEILVFCGPSLLEVVQKYNLYGGGGCLPPKWGLGFTYRTHTLFSGQEVLQEVQAFADQGFPLDFIGLEPGWMDRSYPCSYVWDPGRFPQPAAFLQTLREKGVKINLWINPYIAPASILYDRMLPYAGTHTVWNGIVPDYTVGEARGIFTDYFGRQLIQGGVAGFKIDECDGYDKFLWPDAAAFPSGTEAEQMRQVYGLLMQDMLMAEYRKINRRTYGLVRASNAGGCRFPFVLYNDYYRHEDFITALINSGFAGVLWTPEVRDSATGEEWLRRMQSVCFSPLAMINAWGSGTKPWSYPEVFEAVKGAALLRMRLLPYLYSTFAEYHFHGTPPIRPMPLVQGFRDQQKAIEGQLDDTQNPYKLALRQDIKDQYMLGGCLLVAPVFTGQTSRTVILPEGKWYDFYTGKLAGENQTITIEAKLEEIPLFVPDGGIIPMIPPQLRTPQTGEILPLEVRHYGTAPGRFLLYDDDGETFDYENGEYSWTELAAGKGPDGNLAGSQQRLSGTIFQYSDISWKFMELKR